MRRTLVVLWLLWAGLQAGSGQERLRIESFPSRFLGTSNRTIQIYLPPSYDREPNRRYPVLYLHDGQNVFSSAGTNVAFGWGSWELDKTVDALCRDGRMREIIMVAVDNNGAGRMTEYSGLTRATNAAGPSADPGGNTDYENYAAFLITELKPGIDREFRTLPDPANTGVMGSSMGGICSLALAWEHPDVFGRAASLSGAFQVNQTNFLLNVLTVYRGAPKPVRIYLDSGVVDFRGGDDNCALTARAGTEFRRIGWKGELQHYVDAKPMTEAELDKSGLRRDKWAEAQTSQHNEFYWRLRSWRALVFLFPPPAKPPAI